MLTIGLRFKGREKGTPLHALLPVALTCWVVCKGPVAEANSNSSNSSSTTSKTDVYDAITAQCHVTSIVTCQTGFILFKIYFIFSFRRGRFSFLWDMRSETCFLLCSDDEFTRRCPGIGRCKCNSDRLTVVYCVQSWVHDWLTDWLSLSLSIPLCSFVHPSIHPFRLILGTGLW